MTLETERLFLRPFTPLDAEEVFHNWANDPEVTRYMTWNPHTDISMTEYVIGRWMREYENPKTVRFGIVNKATGDLMGCIDVVRFLDGQPEIGYCSGRRFWGNGYMTEAAGRVIEYLKELGYEKVYISAEVENIGSNRVIQKLGLHLIGCEEQALELKQNRRVWVNKYEKTL